MPRLPGTAPARSARARDTPRAGRERLFLCGRARQGKPFLAIFSGCFAVINVAIRGVQGLVSSACWDQEKRKGEGSLGLAGKACLAAHQDRPHGRCEKEKRKFSIFCLTTARLSRRYTSSRPHRLAGPGQRPFTPSTGVQIPLGTPTRNQALTRIVRAFSLWGQICPTRCPAGLGKFCSDAVTFDSKRLRPYTIGNGEYAFQTGGPDAGIGRQERIGIAAEAKGAFPLHWQLSPSIIFK